MIKRLHERLNMEKLRFSYTRTGSLPHGIVKNRQAPECLMDTMLLVGWEMVFVIEEDSEPDCYVLTVACSIDEIGISASFWTDTGLDDTELLANSILGSMYKSVSIDGGITKQIIASIFRFFADYAVRMEIR